MVPLGKRLQDAVELEAEQRLANVGTPDAELRGELAFRGEAVPRLEGPDADQVAQLAQDRVGRTLDLDRRQRSEDRRAAGGGGGGCHSIGQLAAG